MSVISKIAGSTKRKHQIYERISKNLSDIRNEKIHSGNINAAFTTVYRRPPEKEDDKKRFDNVISDIGVLLGELPSHFDSILKEGTDLEWEESANYKRWINRVVRWVVSITLAVALYSTAVWLSELTCDKRSDDPQLCVRVPIKDWFNPQSVEKQ